MKSNRILKIMALMAIFLVCTLLGVLSLHTPTAKADESTFHELGASIRVSTNNSGIRFGFGLPSGVTGSDYQVGTLIIPKSELGDKALLHNDDDVSSSTLNYREIVCSKNWIPNSEIPGAQSGYNYYFATMTEIPTTRYSEVLCVRSYYYQTNVMPYEFYYSDIVERSIGYTASAAMNNGESDTYGIIDNIVKVGFGDTALTVNSAHELINSGATETFTAVNSKGYLPVWSTSDDTVGTGTITNGGVFTADRTGDVNVVATIGNVTESKTVYIMGTALMNDNVSVCSRGWDVSDQGFINKSYDGSGNMVISARFRGDNKTTDYEGGRPCLVLRDIPSKAYFQKLISEGYTCLKFGLTVGGTSSALVDDLYVFGTQLISFPKINGAYQVTVSLQHIVDNYENIGTKQLGKGIRASWPIFNQMFIAWDSNEASDDGVDRVYTFTISGREFKAAPTVSVDFASGSSDTIGIGGTSTLVATTNWTTSDVVWSSSDTTVATVSNSGVVTGVAGGVVTITANVGGTTASKTIYVGGKALTTSQIGINAYGWDQTNNADYFGITTGGSGELIVTAKFSGSTTDYPSIALRNLYAQSYYQNLLDAGYTKVAFTLAVGGANASDVSDLYVLGKKLGDFGRNASGAYAVAFDLQYIIDNYSTIGGIGTSVKAANAYVDQMLIAWKSTDWTTRNYVFTISNPIFAKGVLAANNIGLRANGYNMNGNTSWLTVETGTSGEIIIGAKFQANATYYPFVSLRNLYSATYYTNLYNEGYRYLLFDLEVGGASASNLDVHILATGQTISQFTKVNGVYKIWISLEYLKNNRDAIENLGTNSGQVGQTGSKSQFFISWRSPSGDYSTVRNYVFTISNTRFSTTQA